MDGRFIYPRGLSSPWKEGRKPKEGTAIDPQPALSKGVREESAICWLGSEDLRWDQMKRERFLRLLLWFSVATGILPGGRRVRQWSAWGVLRTGLAMALALIMVVANVVIYSCKSFSDLDMKVIFMCTHSYIDR